MTADHLLMLSLPFEVPLGPRSIPPRSELRASLCQHTKYSPAPVVEGGDDLLGAFFAAVNSREADLESLYFKTVPCSRPG